MNQESLKYHVYDRDNTFLASYGLGWNVAEIFNGTRNAETIILKHGQKEISYITKSELKRVK